YNRGHNPFSMIHTMALVPETDASEQTGSDETKLILLNDGEGNKTYRSAGDALSGYHGGAAGPLLVLRVCLPK
ncbi:MAG: hypothetical protein K6G07_05005, partial [Lachnospiraceae bacterium]|nr:hypothetical protein [Lachnospiraceae bacterium]